MEAKELRISNYVNFDFHKDSGGTKGIEVFISDLEIILQSNFKSKYYTPIPLTEEWLVRFGFERTSYGRKFKGFHLGASSRVLATDVLSGFSWEQVVDEKYLRILYVHQLQNLYFALTNEELTK
mgnify:CR=1 FL=1